MTEPERRTLLANSRGSLCVAYRLPKAQQSARSAAALGLAVALGAGSVAAQDEFDPAATPAMPLQLTATANAVDCDDELNDVELTTVTITGGLIVPQRAEWLAAEELSAMALPEVSEDAFLDEPTVQFSAAPPSK